MDKSQRARPDLQQLAAAHVYLTWVNNGALECVESGGHYRPNHHAELAKTMFRCGACARPWRPGPRCLALPAWPRLAPEAGAGCRQARA